ncbi:MAG: esterase-like activity of phytase family protein [Rhodobacteraceae bacterium]|nr:esterase-like activity of phytase family protein [Paracoccaceae bacterium]
MKHIIASLLACLAGLPLAAAELEFVGRYVWSEPGEAFGEVSGMEIAADGLGFAVVSDRGWIGTGRLERGADGAVSGVAGFRMADLVNRKGKALKGHESDSEGLAGEPGGPLFVSFEGYHRVWRYDRPFGAAKAIGDHAGFATLQNNSGLEALAIGADGALYAIPERSGEWERPFPVYRYRHGVWDDELSIPREGRFLPAGADFGPDGRLYIVERDFLWYAGFASRIRRFDLTELGLSEGETLLVTAFGTHDNLEAIALWQDAAGAIRLTLVSDDNGNLLQRTEFVDYRLVEAGAE